MARFSHLAPPARNELWATLALRHAKGIGAHKGKLLIDAFGSAFAAVEAGLSSPQHWVDTGAVSLVLARKFATEGWRESAKLEWDLLQNPAVHFLFLTDSGYPELLRQIDDPPLLLYYKGDASLLHGPGIGIVGSRDCTREGIAVSAYFAKGLAQAGVVTVSGMAKGIDRAAHVGGLMGVGSSIAVLGTGIDVPYPRCNVDLYAALMEKGLVVSEFAPGTHAKATNFPIRNRIISGLSHGLLVVEAAGRSGSLITARLALEQGRDVFAVPGHTLSALSQGCRSLVRNGAKAVFSADDILEDLAPLLALESRRALDARRSAEARKKCLSAKDMLQQDIANSFELLPESDIPWVAPESSRPVNSRGQGSGTKQKIVGNPASAPAANTDTGDLRANGMSLGDEATATGLGSERTANAEFGGEGATGATSAAGSSVIENASATTDTSVSENASSVTETATVGASTVAVSTVVAKQMLSGCTPDERKLIAAICSGIKHIDELSRLLEKDVASLSAVLLMLEMRGLVAKEAGMFYRVSESICQNVLDE